MAEDNINESGQIDSFFNIAMLEEEKDLVVTEVLTSVLNKIQEVAKASNDLLGFKSLREAVDGIQSLEKSIHSLNQEKLKTLDIAYKEAKIRRENAAAEEKLAGADLKKVQKDKITITTRKTAPAAKQENQEVISEIKAEGISVTDLSKKYSDLLKEKQRLKDTGQTNSGLYTQVIKELERYEAELQKTIGLTEKLNVTQPENFKAGIKTQIDIREGNATPALVADDGVKDRIQKLDLLKQKLNEIEREQEKIRANGDSAGTSGLFTQLDNDAQLLRKDIVLLTQDLGKYANKQLEILSEEDPFKRLVMQAREAKKEFADLRVQSNIDPTISTDQVEKAKQKWLSLENQIRDVRQEASEALKGSPNPQLKQQIDQLTKDIKEASTEAGFLTYRMQQVGKTKIGINSEAFKNITSNLAEADKKIIDLFAKLKKIAPEAAKTLAAQVPIPKTAGDPGRQFEKEIAAANALNSTYQALQTQLRQLQAEAQELASKGFLGIATEKEKGRLIELEVQIGELASGINKIDNITARAAVGQRAYTRQLFSLQQVLRETPSLAYGFSTFVSAISNNLPILADDIKAIREENKRLTASGKDAQSVWSALAKSFFSWQTLLLAGISILAIYAEEIGHFVVELFRSDEANKKVYASSKQYADLQQRMSATLKELTKSYSDLNEIRNRSNERGLRQLKEELDLMQSAGLSLENQLSIRKRIAEFEGGIARSKSNATASDIASQIDDNAKFVNTPRKQELSFLDDNIKEQQANQIPLVTKTDTRGNEVVTKQNSKEDIERAKVLESRFKAEKDFRIKEIALDDELEKVKKQRTDRLLKVDQEYEAARVAAHGKANEQILLQEAQRIRDNKTVVIEDEFLFKAGNIGNEKKEVTLSKQRSADQSLLEEQQRIKDKRLDPAKDKQLKAAEDRAKAAKTDAETAKEFVQQINTAQIESQESVDKIREEAAARDKEASDQRHTRVIANAQKEADFIIAKNQDILNDETSTYKQRIAATNELARARKITANAEFSEANRLFKRGELNAAELDEAEKKFQTTSFQIEKETTRSKLELQQQYFEKKTAAERKQLEAELSLNTKINDEISKNIEVSLRNRLTSQQEAFDQRKKLIDEQFKQELLLAGFSNVPKTGKDGQSELQTFVDSGDVAVDDNGEVKGKRKTLAELQAMRAEHESKILELVRESLIQQNEIIKQELEKQEKLYGEALDAIQRQFEQRDLEKVIKLTTDITDLNKQLTAGNILFKSYAAKRKQIQSAFEREQLNDSIKNLDRQLEAAKKEYNAEEEAATLHALEMAKIRLRIAEQRQSNTQPGSEARKAADAEVDAATAAISGLQAKADAYKRFADVIIGVEKEKQEKIKDLHDKAREDINDLTDTIASNISKIQDAFAALQQARFDARQTKIQEEMDALDKLTEKEREGIDQSIKNEEEKNKALKELEVRRNADREALDRKQRKLDYDRAKAARTAALANIAIDLSQSIAKILFNAFALSSNPLTAAYAPIAYAQIPLAIGAAALQTAAVLSTPLPKYATGTENHPGGPAVLGDAYRSELVQEPSGKMWITPAKPGIYDLPKGTVVKPDAAREIQKGKTAAADQSVDKAKITEKGKTALSMPVPSVKPISTIREIEMKEYRHTLEKHVNNFRDQQKMIVNNASRVEHSKIMRPEFHFVLPAADHSVAMSRAVTVQVMQQAGIMPEGDAAAIGQMESSMKRGLTEVVKAIKNIPQPIIKNQSYAELLMKYGSDIFKHL